jgi:integrase
MTGEQPDPERQLSGLPPHDLRYTFGFRLAEETGNDPYELERRLGAHRRELRRGSVDRPVLVTW